MLSQYASVLALAASVLAGPIAKADTIGLTPSSRMEIFGRSPAEEFVTLQDGNQCEVVTGEGLETSRWNMDDWATMFGEASQVLRNNMSRNQRAQVGTTMRFRDRNNFDHEIDCEVTTTGAASVSLADAMRNVNTALIAAEDLADENWYGLTSVSRTSLFIYFGDVVAMSIGLNVLN
jgi:hypothetical protein